MLRVASVPASHVYVRHLADPAGVGAVRRLSDPVPRDGRKVPGGWWPPAMLESGWVSEHADRFDVFHLQFGFDARTPEQLRELVSELRQASKPFVYTVHDLRNPHHASRAEHDAQLDVLIPAADAVVTLTDGAAYEIKRRWARQAIVLAAPARGGLRDHAQCAAHATRRTDRPLERLTRRIPHRRPCEESPREHEPRAGATCHPLCCSRVAGSGTPGRRTPGHPRPGRPRYDAALVDFLQSTSDAGLIDLRLHDYFADDELWRYLASTRPVGTAVPFRHALRLA